MELPDRDKREADFARQLGKVTASHRVELQGLLRAKLDAKTPAQVAKSEADLREFWERVEKETKAALLVPLFVVWNDSAILHGLVADQAMEQAHAYAIRQATTVSRQMNEHSQKLVAKTFLKAETAQSEAAGKAREAGKPFQRGDILNKGDVLELTTKVFGPSRTAGVARTETVRAQNNGGRTAVRRTRPHLVAYWRHSELRPQYHSGAMKDPCEICTPREGLPWYLWDGEEPGFCHPGCDCMVEYLDPAMGEFLTGSREPSSLRAWAEEFGIFESLRERIASGLPLSNLLEYSPDQERDESGRFAAGGGATSTPAFKEWFGDSKVTHETGQPMVMYHGTHAPEFDEFKPNQLGLVFFTNDAYQTNRWSEASEKLMYKDRNEYWAAHAPRTVPAYLSIQKPFDQTNPEHVAEIVKHIPAERVEQGRKFWPDFYEKHPNGGVADIHATPPDVEKLHRGGWQAVEHPEVLSAIKAAGFDGIKTHEENSDGERFTSYAVFRPEQIKSAIGNKGTFSPHSPRITEGHEDQPRDEHGRFSGSENISASVAGYADHSTPSTVRIAPSGQVKLTTPKTAAESSAMLTAMNRIHDVAFHEATVAQELPPNHPAKVAAELRLRNVQSQLQRAIGMSRAFVGQPTELDRRLVDYKPDRSLTGPSSKPIAELLPSSRTVLYSQVPFLGEMHNRMGIDNPLTLPVDQYVDRRGAMFRAQPVETVPLDRLVVTQPRVNGDRVKQIQEHPETAGKEHPFLARHGGETYVMNGHHRAVADALGDKTEITGHVLNLDRMRESLLEYSPDQERDELGRFSGSGSGSMTSTTDFNRPSPQRPPLPGPPGAPKQMDIDDVVHVLQRNGRPMTPHEIMVHGNAIQRSDSLAVMIYDHIDQEGDKAKIAEHGAENKFALPGAFDRPSEPMIPRSAERSSEIKALVGTPVSGVAALKDGAGANQSIVVTLENGDKALFKPAAGERRNLRVTVTGPYFEREAAASSIAEIVGVHDLVPPTVVRTVNGQVGCIHKWIEPAEVAVKVGPDQRYDGETDAKRGAAFDFLIGNSDRHLGNWLIGDKHNLVLIDHGLTFPNRNDVPLHHAKLLEHVRGDIPAEVKEWAAHGHEIDATLKAHGIGDTERHLTQERLRMLGNAKTFRDLRDDSRMFKATEFF